MYNVSVKPLRSGSAVSTPTNKDRTLLGSSRGKHAMRAATVSEPKHENTSPSHQAPIHRGSDESMDNLNKAVTTQNESMARIRLSA